MSEHPIIVWVTIVVTAAVVVSAAVPKVFGPISEALSRWQEAKRQRALALDDDYEERFQRLRKMREDDRADFQHQLEEVRAEFSKRIACLEKARAADKTEFERHMRAQDQQMSRIERWSRKAYELITGAGLLIDPPPLDGFDST